LVTLLFLSSTVSTFEIVLIFIAVAINFLVFFLYKGTPNKALSVALYGYFLLLSVNSVVKLSRYMHLILESGPYCVLIPAIIITSYFCLTKGIEALSRAGVIIGAFVLIFILYIVIYPLFNTNYNNIKLTAELDLLPFLTMLFPSALYITLNTKIENKSISHFTAYSIAIFLIIGYYILASSTVDKCYPIHFISKSVKYGVFKGGDCLYLALITISVLYFISNSALAVSNHSENCKISSTIFLALVLIMSLISAYFYGVAQLLSSEILLSIVLFVLIISVVVALCLNKIKKNE
jgi:hypothetical protein